MKQSLDWDEAEKVKGPTPKPWTTSMGSIAEIYIQVGKYRYGPIWDGLGNTSEMVANANLVAAAPDMYEALVWAEAALAPFSKDPTEKSGMNLIRAALAKARGE